MGQSVWCFAVLSWQNRHVLPPPRHPTSRTSAQDASEYWCRPIFRSAGVVWHFPTPMPRTCSLCRIAFSRASCQSTSRLLFSDSPAHPSVFISLHTAAGHVGQPSLRCLLGTIVVWQNRQLLLSPMHPGTLPMLPSAHAWS